MGGWVYRKIFLYEINYCWALGFWLYGFKIIASARIDMKVAGILSTLGKVDIEPLLISLCNQTYPISQLVVVDQGPSQHVEASCKEYSNRLNITYVKSEERGASRGRNLGLSLADCGAVFFPDDDCHYKADFVGKLVAAVADGYGFASGMVFTNENGDCGRLPIKLGMRQDIVKSNLLYAFIEFTFLITTQALGRERFNPLMGVGSGTPAGSDEGADLLMRLLERGVKGIFVPDAIAYHPDKVDLVDESVLRRARSYATGRGYLLKSHWFGIRILTRELLRPVIGFFLYLIIADYKRARYYYNVAYGKFRGLFLRLQ